jgi:hypothetical protein
LVKRFLATNSINSIFASNKFIKNELYKINQQQSAQNIQLIFCYSISSLVLNQTMAQNKPQNVYSNAILIPSQPSGLLGSEIIPLASKTDAQGNTYVIGSFKGTVDLDPGVGVVSATSTNSGGSPANNYQATYLVKFNKYGEYVWSKSFTSAAGSQNWPKGIDFYSPRQNICNRIL